MATNAPYTHEKPPVSLFLFLLFYKLAWFMGSFCHVWDICFSGWWDWFKPQKKVRGLLGEIAGLALRNEKWFTIEHVSNKRMLFQIWHKGFWAKSNSFSTDSLKLYTWKSKLHLMHLLVEALLHFIDQNLKPLKPSSFAYELMFLHLRKTVQCEFM